MDEQNIKYDLFISYYQRNGGHLAQIIKLELEKIDKNLKIFLDVDDLNNIHDLEDHIKKSNNILLLITEGVLERPYIIKELRASIKYNKNIIVVWDKDHCPIFPNKEKIDKDISCILDIKAIIWNSEKMFRKVIINDIIVKIKKLMGNSLYENSINHLLPLLPIKLIDTKDNKIINVKENLEKILKIGYACASYVWNNKGDLNFLINKVSKIGIKYIWIDKLCINQDNENEKQQEIGKMQEYYKYCDTVVVWVGKGIEQKFDNLEIAMYQYSIDMWFTRMWTIQEAIFPPRMVVITDWGILYPDSEINLPSGYDCGFQIGAKEIRNMRIKSTNCCSDILTLGQGRDSSFETDKIFALSSMLPYTNKLINGDTLSKTEENYYQILCDHDDISFLSNILYNKTITWKPDINNCAFPSNIKRIPFRNVPKACIINNKLHLYVKSFKIIKELNIDIINKNKKYNVLKVFGLNHKNIIDIMKNTNNRIYLDEKVSIEIIKKINTDIYLDKVYNFYKKAFIEWVDINDNELWPILRIGNDIQCDFVSMLGLQSKGLEIAIVCKNDKIINKIGICFLPQEIGIFVMSLPIEKIIIE